MVNNYFLGVYPYLFIVGWCLPGNSGLNAKNQVLWWFVVALWWWLACVIVHAWG